jgi:2-polyprenyl-6-hydroxyphenyl methylase/3-demethylubiquinone-9 3-methyltransferase
MSENYYAANLNAHKLFNVYQTQLPRVKQYLEAEVAFVRRHFQGGERVLEIGAGYGRIMKELATNCASITGIDISSDNVRFGVEYLADMPNAKLLVMDAHNVQLNETYDVLLCLQNALSAIKAQPLEYVKTITALLAPGGRAFCSSYNAKFWEDRLAWFHEQAGKGLLGEIEHEQTRDGVIVCKDGFRSVTLSPSDLDAMGKASGLHYEVCEVDESSVFLVLTKN